jgi:hypothetical protein
VRTSANDTQRPVQSSRPALPTAPLVAHPAQHVHHEMGPARQGPKGSLRAVVDAKRLVARLVEVNGRRSAPRSLLM